MIEITFVINIITLSLWFIFVIYLFKNKKVVAINKFGLMLAVSVLYPYIIGYDLLHDFKLNPDLKYEITICRLLILATFYSTVRGSVRVNKKLTRLSQMEENLLKPNENVTKSQLIEKI